MGSMNIIVVGAGIAGLSTAWSLRKRGHEESRTARQYEAAAGHFAQAEAYFKRSIKAYPAAYRRAGGGDAGQVGDLEVVGPFAGDAVAVAQQFGDIDLGVLQRGARQPPGLGR